MSDTWYRSDYERASYYEREARKLEAKLAEAEADRDKALGAARMLRGYVTGAMAGTKRPRKTVLADTAWLDAAGEGGGRG